MTTLRVSIIVHLAALFMVIGCAVHKPTVVLHGDPEIEAGQQFVFALADKMPQWDADDAIAQYEKVEIAVVKADIEVAKLAPTKMAFLVDVAILHVDWDKLVALDGLLRQLQLT